MLYLALINSFEQHKRHAKRYYLGYRESEPQSVERNEFAQHPCRRQQNDKLAGKRHDKAVNTFSQSLKRTGKHYRSCGNDKVGADYPQRRNADREHLGIRLEQPDQQKLGHEIKYRHADSHDTASKHSS